MDTIVVIYVHNWIYISTDITILYIKLLFMTEKAGPLPLTFGALAPLRPIAKSLREGDKRVQLFNPSKREPNTHVRQTANIHLLG